MQLLHPSRRGLFSPEKLGANSIIHIHGYWPQVLSKILSTKTESVTTLGLSKTKSYGETAQGHPVGSKSWDQHMLSTAIRWGE